MTEKQQRTPDQTVKQFLTAAREGNADTLNTLITRFPQLLTKCDKDKNTALLMAVAAIEKGSVTVLLTAGADLRAINNNGRNAIFLSIESTSSADNSSLNNNLVQDTEDILKMLLEAGCSPLSKTTAGYPIHSANQRVLRILLDYKDKWLKDKISGHVVAEIIAPADATWTACAEQTALINLISSAIEDESAQMQEYGESEKEKQQQRKPKPQKVQWLSHTENTSSVQPATRNETAVDTVEISNLSVNEPAVPAVSTYSNANSMCHRTNADSGVMKTKDTQNTSNGTGKKKSRKNENSGTRKTAQKAASGKNNSTKGKSIDELMMDEAKRNRDMKIRNYR